MFKLKDLSYTGDGITPLMQDVLGKDNYQKYFIAQTPLGGGEEVDTISITLTRGELNLDRTKIATIGLIKRVF